MYGYELANVYRTDMKSDLECEGPWRQLGVHYQCVLLTKDFIQKPKLDQKRYCYDKGGSWISLMNDELTSFKELCESGFLIRRILSLSHGALKYIEWKLGSSIDRCVSEKSKILAEPIHACKRNMVLEKNNFLMVPRKVPHTRITFEIGGAIIPDKFTKLRIVFEKGLELNGVLAVYNQHWTTQMCKITFRNYVRLAANSSFDIDLSLLKTQEVIVPSNLTISTGDEKELQEILV